MLPYIILASCPAFFGLLCNRSGSVNANEKSKKNFMILCGIVLFIMIAFRHYEVGSTDSTNYYNHWKLYSSYNFVEMQRYMEDAIIERGYMMTVWILSHIMPIPQLAFILSGLLFTVSVCCFVYKNCDDVVVGMAMYITLGLYTFMIQGMRQSIAMSICLFAIEFCKKRKFIPFLLLILLAMQFHRTAIVFVVIYFLCNFSLKFSNIVAFSFLAFLLLAFTGPLVAFGNNYFEREYAYSVDSGGFIAVAIYIIIIFAALLFATNKKYNKDFALFFYITAIGLIFYLMRYFDVLMVERISFYFMFGQLVILPSVISCFKPRDRQIINLIVYLLCITLFIYRLNGSDLVPFKFFWQ